MTSSPVDEGPDAHADDGAAVGIRDDVIGDVYETSSEVAGVGRLKRGVGETFTSAVSGDEVFENGQTFPEVRK